MSRLHARISNQAGSARAAAGQMHPAGTADTPMTMPMVSVYFAGGDAYVQQMIPLVTASGAMIPAVAPGQFGQVHLAGSGRY